jgi:hypothetical protein
MRNQLVEDSGGHVPVEGESLHLARVVHLPQHAATGHHPHQWPLPRWEAPIHTKDPVPHTNYALIPVAPRDWIQPVFCLLLTASKNVGSVRVLGSSRPVVPPHAHARVREGPRHLDRRNPLGLVTAHGALYARIVLQERPDHNQELRMRIESPPSRPWHNAFQPTGACGGHEAVEEGCELVTRKLSGELLVELSLAGVVGPPLLGRVRRGLDLAQHRAHLRTRNQAFAIKLSELYGTKWTKGRHSGRDGEQRAAHSFFPPPPPPPRARDHSSAPCGWGRCNRGRSRPCARAA